MVQTAKHYYDILNCLGVIHECDGQTDRQTDRQMDRLHRYRKCRASLRCPAKD